jgi:predicted permease
VASFLLIFVCFALGLILRVSRVFPENTPQVLNRFIIYLSLPALTLAQVHRLDLSGGVWVPVSMAWILFALSMACFVGLGRVLQLPRKTMGALILTAGLGNTSFVGFPLLEALYGPGAIATGILVDQPGTFLVASTLGIAIAAIYSGAEVRWAEILKKVLWFPPFFSLVAALLLRPVEYPEWVMQALDRLGATLVPLALVAVGAQLRLNPERLRRVRRELSFGLTFKLLLAPAFFWLLYFRLAGQSGPVARITVVESAMAPMITAGILAHEYGLDSDTGNLMIGLGIPLSLATVPLWAMLLG